jgi:hypothetical protein
MSFDTQRELVFVLAFAAGYARGFAQTSLLLRVAALAPRIGQ